MGHGRAGGDVREAGLEEGERSLKYLETGGDGGEMNGSEREGQMRQKGFGRKFSVWMGELVWKVIIFQRAGECDSIKKRRM